MMTRTARIGTIAATLAALSFMAAGGCSKDKKNNEPAKSEAPKAAPDKAAVAAKAAQEKTTTAVTGDAKLYAVKFHHDD